jgi:hypothetical protein
MGYYVPLPVSNAAITLDWSLTFTLVPRLSVSEDIIPLSIRLQGV